MRDILNDPKYREANNLPFKFNEGDIAIKNVGDYTFRGIVLSAFRNRKGSPRYTVENEEGIIHIFNNFQLEHE